MARGRVHLRARSRGGRPGAPAEIRPVLGAPGAPLCRPRDMVPRGGLRLSPRACARSATFGHPSTFLGLIMHPFPTRRTRPAPGKSTGGFHRIRLRPAALWALASALAVLPSTGRSCACGCGIYEVGTSSMLPTGVGSMVDFDYDYQDQNHNWSGDSQAPNADNSDKDIRTSWETFGYQDMLSRSWGIRLEV